jgi:hypothetical protein
MADDGYMAALMSLLQDPQRAAYALSNGAQNFGQTAKWAATGMNGPPPAPYDGSITPNQEVAMRFPRGTYLRPFGDQDYGFGSLAPGRR